jgi:predicted membrane metal-binding protein
MDLITMSCLSAMATAPFAAQHFGTVTPWGLVANIIGIPLTGLWIMPTGMILTIGGLFGLDWLVATLMTAGLHALYHLADWFAGFPLAGWKVAPPGYAALLVMVTGMMISQLLTKPVARIGLVLVAAGLYGRLGRFHTEFYSPFAAPQKWCWQQIMARHDPIQRFPIFLLQWPNCGWERALNRLIWRNVY